MHLNIHCNNSNLPNKQQKSQKIESSKFSMFKKVSSDFQNLNLESNYKSQDVCDSCSLNLINNKKNKNLSLIIKTPSNEKISIEKCKRTFVSSNKSSSNKINLKLLTKSFNSKISNVSLKKDLKV